MKRIATGVFVLPLLLAGFARAADVPNIQAAADVPNIQTVLASQPLSFEANAGQFNKRVKFLARAPGKRLFLVPEGMVLVLDQSSAPDAAQSIVRIELQGVAKKAQFEGVDRLAAITNYFSAGLAITDVPNFARVRQQDVYSGIDVLYYGSQGRLEYDFIVAPGADPRRIRLRLAGHDAARVTKTGDLVLATAVGELVMHKPFAYQERDGQRTEVPARYTVRGNEVRFELAAYDRGRTLVIDPLLAYSTRLGGTNADFAKAVSVDGSGNVYITGETFSSDFPVAGALQTKKLGTADAFVTKMNANGGALIYSTYLGGKNGSTAGRGIKVDAAGNAYFTGTTSSSAYPITSGAYRTTGTGGFVTKLTPQGNALIYSTFTGASSGHAIAIDAAGNAYVTGQAFSGFPTTPGAFQPTANGFASEAYVLKLNPTGSAAVYSTFLGGSGEDTGNGIAVDAAGNAYVAGLTASPNFPVANAYQPVLAGNQDAFVAKLDSTGAILPYSTYLGGTLRDFANAVAVDSQGNAYVAGTTYSLDFPVSRAFQPTKAFTGSGHEDVNQAFITKLDASGQALVYSSYLGGRSCFGPGVTSCLADGDDDSALAIAVDAAGIAYVGGYARSVTFPQVEAIQSAANIYGPAVPFVAKVQDRASAVLLYSVMFGTKESGFSNGGATGIAVDAAGNAYIAGHAPLPFPVTPGAFKTSGGLPVIFKLSPGRFTTNLSASSSSPTSADPVTLTAIVTSPVPEGLVTFYDNGNSLATVSVSGGTAMHTATFAAGVHEITAIYSGDNKVSRPLFLPVKQATTN
jgi:hypothetical protein